MPHAYLFLILLFLGVPAGAKAQLESFAWLIGKWKLQDKEVYEEWRWSNDKKSLEGISYRIRNGDSIITEKITLHYTNGSFFYTPDVAGDQPSVDFKINQQHPGKFTAENPDHDFPKIIQYAYVKRNDEEWIEASISGDGKSIPYSYKRVR